MIFNDGWWLSIVYIYITIVKWLTNQLHQLNHMGARTLSFGMRRFLRGCVRSHRETSPEGSPSSSSNVLYPGMELFPKVLIWGFIPMKNAHFILKLQATTDGKGCWTIPLVQRCWDSNPRFVSEGWNVCTLLLRFVSSLPLGCTVRILAVWQSLADVDDVLEWHGPKWHFQKTVGLVG